MRHLVQGGKTLSLLPCSPFRVPPEPRVNAAVRLQAYGRITRDVQELRSGESRQYFKNLRALSAAVVENGGVVSTHPLGF